MKLQDVDRIYSQAFADFLGVLQDMAMGKYILVRVFRLGWPAVIHWRDFRRGEESLVFVARQSLAQQPVAFAVPVGPGGVEEITAQIDGGFERAKRTRIVGAAPSAHAPQAVRKIAGLDAGPSQF